MAIECTMPQHAVDTRQSVRALRAGDRAVCIGCGLELEFTKDGFWGPVSRLASVSVGEERVMFGEVFTSSDGWQALHDLPTGAVLIDERGAAYQVQRRNGRRDGETWLAPVSDEYALIVYRPREGQASAEPLSAGYAPDGNLTLVWSPK